MGLLCAALLLSGCQPTTDTAIVTPKSAIAGAKMVDEATVGNVPEQVQAPETCAMELVTEDASVKISVDAKVTVPEVDGIRLKKVETRVFSQSDMDNLQENLLQGSALEQRIYTEKELDAGIRWTQDEICNIIHLELEHSEERYRQAEEMGWEDPYSAVAFLDWWNEQLEIAPESFQTKEASTKILYDKYAAEKFLSEEYESGNSNIIWGYTALDGQNYNFFLNNNWSSEFKSVAACLVKGYYYQTYGEWHLYTSEQDYYVDNYDVGSYDADSEDCSMSAEGLDEKASEAAEKKEAVAGEEFFDEWVDVPAAEEEWSLETPLEELKARGDALVDALGLEGMELAAYKKCSIYDGYIDFPATAVNLIYTPVVDGIPVTYTDYRYAYDNTNIDYSESFQVAYDDEGLAQVKWLDPAKIYDMSDEYVFLLPFSDILEIFQEEAPELQRSYSTEETVKKSIHITDIKLGYMWVPDESAEMEGMLLPVWDFIGSWTTYWSGNEEQGVDPSWNSNTSPYQSFLTVNAMDGSIMEGYVRAY